MHFSINLSRIDKKTLENKNNIHLNDILSGLTTCCTLGVISARTALVRQDMHKPQINYDAV